MHITGIIGGEEKLYKKHTQFTKYGIKSLPQTEEQTEEEKMNNALNSYIHNKQ